MLLMVFMAVTSCGSAELIAVSSLLTYDVYKTYVHPAATGEEVRTYIRTYNGVSIDVCLLDVG